jgi:hypothetical protein
VTQAAAINAVRQRFRTEVATPNTLPVVLDNGPLPEPQPREWARATVTIETSALLTMGRHRRWRSTGALMVNLFCEGGGNKGDKPVVDLAQEVIDAFQGVTTASPSIRYGAPQIIGAGTHDGAWYSRAVRVPFTTDYDEA